VGGGGGAVSEWTTGNVLSQHLNEQGLEARDVYTRANVPMMRNFIIHREVAFKLVGKMNQ